jgi:hypothetical protein
MAPGQWGWSCVAGEIGQVGFDKGKNVMVGGAGLMAFCLRPRAAPPAPRNISELSELIHVTHAVLVCGVGCTQYQVSIKSV